MNDGQLIEHDGRKWLVVLGPGPVADIRNQLAQWRLEHPELGDDQIVLDLIRTVGQDELRVRVAAE